MENELMKYQDFCCIAEKYTRFISWQGSRQQLINNWLNPIKTYSKEQSEFYGTSKQRDCGWYIEKSKILNLLKDNIPLKNDDELNLILNELCDYITQYKDPKSNN